MKLASKINRKARINRHLRIFKENISHTKNLHNVLHNYAYYVVLFMITFLIPIYPTLASFLYNNSQYEFYRWDIDNSSILGSYYSSDEDIDNSTPILESSDSFISVNTILNDERDLVGTNEILEYAVEPGESFYSLSYKFKISTNSIYWANNFKKSHTLQPGDLIKIPPVSGLIHQVQSWETLSTIAKKYEVDDTKIIEQNLLILWETLKSGEVLVIPWAIKKAPPKPVYKKPTSLASKINTTKTHTFAKYASSQYVNAWGKYNLVWRQPKHTFYWGNCTRYVAQYKNVNWGGNANAWLKNAQAKWHSTGTNPTIGSIIVFDGKWYNPRYGHVWIIMDIKDWELIVSDMNYRRINEVTYRKIPINDRAIKWYVYVD